MIIVFLIICSMNPETVVTFTHGHFNQVVFAVCTAMMPCLLVVCIFESYRKIYWFNLA